VFALSWASQSGQVIALFALYSVFFAIDQSQSKAFIADLEPERRAVAVGAYNVVTGVLYLPASLVAGLPGASCRRRADAPTRRRADPGQVKPLPGGSSRASCLLAGGAT
jgi:hypothetical protein